MAEVSDVIRDIYDVRIWTLALDDVPGPLWPSFAAILRTVERERAACFVFERHRRQYVAAHALMRLMLTAATGGVTAPAAWIFEAGAHGKPRVLGGTTLKFNLSHCEGTVVCAISHSVEIGVDVECLDRRIPLELAGAHFAACECAWLRSLSAAERPIGFLQLWTLKEAYIKATGLGLAQRLDNFAFAFEPLRLTFFDLALGDAGEWRFEQRVIGPRSHIMAAGWRNRVEARVEVKAVSPETLRALVEVFTKLR